MKKNPFAYLKKAPKLKGHRILKPTECIRAGDLYTFVDVARMTNNRPSLANGALGRVPDDGTSRMRVGVTLVDARKSFRADFDGIVYRPVKRKSAKK